MIECMCMALLHTLIELPHCETVNQ